MRLERREGKRGDGEGIGGKGRGETFGCIVVNGDSARGDLGALLVWDVAEDHIAGQAVSDLEGCHLCFFLFLLRLRCGFEVN